MNITATVSRIEAFTWEPPDAEPVTWNITKAKEIVSSRPEDTRICLENIKLALEHNEFAKEINLDYAMTTDLDQAIIVVPTSIDQEKQQAHVTIIDGWHRLTKAAAIGHESLGVKVLQPAEDLACRCTIDPATGMLITITQP